MNKKGFCEKYMDFEQNLYENSQPESSKKSFISDKELLQNPNVMYEEDELLLKGFFKSKIFQLCNTPSQIPCIEGYPRCYSLIDICMYQLDASNKIMFCSNGAHLQNCNAFECSTTFKCQDSYCIPWIYVCDGKWDCAEGFDEKSSLVCGNQIICDHMYKCKNMSHMCLHLGNVCDGKNDCPFSDDELLCGLKLVTCPLQCTCLILAIDCRNVSVNGIISGLTNIYVSVYISVSHIFSLKSIEHKLTETQVLKVPHNDLLDVCNISPFKKLLFLDLSFNQHQSDQEKLFCIKYNFASFTSQ